MPGMSGISAFKRGAEGCSVIISQNSEKLGVTRKERVTGTANALNSQFIIDQKQWRVRCMDRTLSYEPAKEMKMKKAANRTPTARLL